MNFDPTPDLFGQKIEPWNAFKPIIRNIEDEPNSCIWDVPYTIPQLSYLTHNHFRYYGKFPSVVAGQILDDFPKLNQTDYVLDNFCGSGTTLVEAKLRGIDSFGVDVSWLAAIASNVKTANVDFSSIQSIAARVVESGANCSSLDLASDKYRDKWWPVETSKCLTAMQSALLQESPGPELDFCLTAFIGIIRRVSFAFDGEVRPHINKEKTPREPLSAFAKKVKDMLSRHQEYLNVSVENCVARCEIADNKAIPREILPQGDCYLVISHPPYLNSFDYSPVYNQEYYWSKPFRSITDDNSRRIAELKAWPAKDRLVEDYYAGLSRCYTEAYSILRSGGNLAVVIGDCTIQKRLEPVLDNCVAIIEKIGFRLDRVNYRTTHYGLGKYAYSHRADYHGEAAKRDAILYFSKPN